jgi:hypothetical protein
VVCALPDIARACGSIFVLEQAGCGVADAGRTCGRHEPSERMAPVVLLAVVIWPFIAVGVVAGCGVPRLDVLHVHWASRASLRQVG